MVMVAGAVVMFTGKAKETLKISLAEARLHCIELPVKIEPLSWK